MFKVILCCISTSSGRCPLLLIQISIYSVDACTLAMVWVGYACVQLKTVSSLLKLGKPCERGKQSQEWDLNPKGCPLHVPPTQINVHLIKSTL